MKQIECNIDGVIIKPLEIYSDKRGWLSELFRTDQLPDNLRPMMAYISSTSAGEIRGPHEHKEQTDHFSFFGSSLFEIYLWDNRPDSASYKKHFRLTTGQDNPVSIIIPPGVVHGYKNVGDRPGLIFNAPDRLYAGEGKKETVDEIRYEERPESGFIIE